MQRRRTSLTAWLTSPWKMARYRFATSRAGCWRSLPRVRSRNDKPLGYGMMLRFMLSGLLATFSCVGQEGSQVYISHCMQCHSPTSATHAPTPDDLAQISWQDILKTLETGAMQVQAQNLSPEERVAVARYVGKAGGAPTLPPMSGFCAAGVHPVATKAMWNGW